MRIEKNSAVLLHYHLTDSDGVVIDSSIGRVPMAYLHGHNNLVSGVERALVGHEVGAKIEVEVAPADGYGTYDPALDVAIPKQAFPPEMHMGLQPGAVFQGPHPTDKTRSQMFKIVEVAGNEVRCTANHPLAGVTLHFQLEVMEVREATAAEIQQGRAFPPTPPAGSGCCNDPNCDN